MKIINDSVCNVVTEGQVTSRMLCSGFLAGGVDACQVRPCEVFCEKSIEKGFHTSVIIFALTSKTNPKTRVSSMCSPGRLRRPPGVLRGKWEVVSGWHRELGRGLRSSEQARRLFTRNQAETVDQGRDRDLTMPRGTARE